MSEHSATIDQAYRLARERYSRVGVDTELALEKLASVSISIQCWQGDDVRGFEFNQQSLSGGIAVTGSHHGAARHADELRADLELALKLIPGTHRVNLHAIYGDFGGEKVDRDAIDVEHFRRWCDWARSLGIALDFNPTCFSHPLSQSGFTLSHSDSAIRSFWIEHCVRSRRIAAWLGKQLGSPAVNNIWIPDGAKDYPSDRLSPRIRLSESLDTIFEEKFDPLELVDSVESKLFGLGSEAYVVGSHEFYLGYATRNQKSLCLDAGHFHPTESIADKISSVLMFVPRLLLHVSRPMRWDSDHVVLLDDPTQAIAFELVRNDLLHRTYIGLDYFDASINRIAAWIIGSRNTLKALLIAFLEPASVRMAEESGDLTARLLWMEESKSLPWSLVWDKFCEMQEVPCGHAWWGDVKEYETNILSQRS
jgi:L-rhamnose isomerase